VNKYLEELERAGIDPNFWCADEYFQRAGWSVHSSFGKVWAEDKDAGFVLPCLSLSGGFEMRGFDVWADLEGYEGMPLLTREFLDYNFIYDPRNFLKMEGGDWAVFRKNSRKFAKRQTHPCFYTDRYHTVVCEEDIKGLFISWLEGKEGEIHDDEVMLNYLLNGDNRKFLIDSDGELIGINVWDENYKYINFRYCICDSKPFLSEYMRLLFYTDAEILGKGKLVNDGGSLDNKALSDFKLKMNPVEIKNVYSWRRKDVG